MLKPAHLFIDACSICQLRCKECPATKMGYEYKVGRGYLKFKDFKKLIDLNPQIKSIEFDNYGELFLNPELTDLIKYAYEKKIEVACSAGVNLNTVKPEVLEKLVKYQFRFLNCSIDGATNETYRIYRVGGNFDTVIKNIETINLYKKQYRSKFPQLQWQFIVFGHNEHEIPLARKMANNLNMKFYPKMNWNSNYSPIKNREFVMAETGWHAVTREENERLSGINYVRPTCLSLWYSPRINWDGRVTGCCWNVWSEFGGNVFTDGYNSCINSEKIEYAKQMLLGLVEPKSDIPCVQCDIFHKIHHTGNFFTRTEIFRYLMKQRIIKFVKKTRSYFLS